MIAFQVKWVNNGNGETLLTIQLNPEQQHILDQAILAGLIRGPEDLIAAGVDALRERLQAHQMLGGETAIDEWVRNLHDWIHSHSSEAPLLSDESTDRSSIYGSRGL